MRKIAEDELLELYRQGKTNRHIAETLGVTQAAVYYRLQNLGLQNNCHCEPAADPGQVRILHGMGVTTIGIAHLLKVNVRAVEQTLKEMGLEDNCLKLREVVEGLPLQKEIVTP